MQKRIVSFILGIVFLLVATFASAFTFLIIGDVYTAEGPEALALVLILPIAMITYLGTLVFLILSIIFSVRATQSDVKALSVISWIVFSIGMIIAILCIISCIVFLAT